MNQEENKKRKGAIIGIVLSFVVIIFLNMYFFGMGWGGCRGGGLVCQLAPKVTYYIQLVTFVFIAYCVEQSIAGQSKRFKMWSWIYVAILAMMAALFLALNGGLVSQIIGGTETECNLLDGRYKSECYTNLAKSKNNPAYCAYVDSSDEITLNCRTFFATQKTDATLCKETDPYCKQQVAWKAKDPKLCMTIPDEYTKAQCLSGLVADLKDYSLCALSPDTFMFTACSAQNLSNRFDPKIYTPPAEILNYPACKAIDYSYKCAVNKTEDNTYLQSLFTTMYKGVFGGNDYMGKTEEVKASCDRSVKNDVYFDGTTVSLFSRLKILACLPPK